jgi:hypothetical protein
VRGANHSERRHTGQQVLFNPLDTELARLRAANARRAPDDRAAISLQMHFIALRLSGAAPALHVVGGGDHR